MTRPLTAALLLLLAGLCSYTAALNDPTDNVLPVDPACVFGLLNSVKASSAPASSADTCTSTNGLLACLGYNVTNNPTIRIFTVDSSTPTWSFPNFMNSTLTFMAKSAFGIKLEIDMRDVTEAGTAAMDTSELSAGYYFIWMLGPNMVPSLAQQNRIQAVDDYFLGNTDLRWNDIHRYYRTQAIYNGSIMGLPIGGRNTFMYYRRDVLAAARLPVPETWEDLLLVARALNGSDFNNDGRADYAMCLQIAGQYCSIEANALIALALAPHTQAMGSNSGWLIDPDTQKTFVNTEAMSKALYLLTELVKYSWPSSVCTDISPYLWNGTCAITLTSEATFQQIGTRRAPNPWRGRGRIAMTLVPGSHQVLDRGTGMLVDCTSLDVCPYATPHYSLALNRTVLVNRAPVNINSGLVMMNSFTPSYLKPITAQLIYLLGGSAQDVTYYFASQSTMALNRYQQLQADPRSLNVWAQYGFNRSEVIDYLTLINTTLDHPNVASDPRFLRAYLFKEEMTRTAYLIANYTPPGVLRAHLARKFASFLQGVPTREFAESIWAGLNLQRTWQDAPAPLSPTTNQPSQDAHWSLGEILAIALPCAAAVLVLVCGVVWAVRRGWMRMRPSGPPSVGPSSTLVVTDVEESTQLWEALPMGAMDEAIRLHHMLVRKLLAKYHGYESATEGDAFIMGFHTAGDALQFATDLQESLLTQPWPSELLEYHLVTTTWAKGAEQGAAAEPEDARAQPTGIGSSPPDMEERYSITKAAPRIRRVKLDMPKNTLQTVFGAQRTSTVQNSLSSQWQPVGEDLPTDLLGPESVLAYRGLRLRVGLHTGLTDQDVISNKTTGGLQYTGQALTLAKAVADSGPGGMTVLSLPAFESWKHERAGRKEKPAQQPIWAHKQQAAKYAQNGRDDDPILMLHMGCYTFTKAPDLSSSGTVMYMAVPRALECRLALGYTALRNTKQLATGVLQAPIGTVSVAFCSMVGYSALLAWNEELAKGALTEYNKLALALLMETGATAQEPGEGAQYLLEQADGLNLAVFGSPTAAMLWGLQMIEQMKRVDWPEELLDHELCESVAVALGNGAEDTEESAVFLFHGPRVKIGIDTGQVTCDVSPATARLTYHGRPMNRAARVMDKAPSGLCWCTHDTVQSAKAGLASGLVRAKQSGVFQLKGLAQAISLYQCIRSSQGHHSSLATHEASGHSRHLNARRSVMYVTESNAHTSLFLTLEPQEMNATGFYPIPPREMAQKEQRAVTFGNSLFASTPSDGENMFLSTTPESSHGAQLSRLHTGVSGTLEGESSPPLKTVKSLHYLGVDHEVALGHIRAHSIGAQQMGASHSAAQQVVVDAGTAIGPAAGKTSVGPSSAAGEVDKANP